ncbi:hypothetical protein [Streptomyces sp. NPDC026092]|uniref:hypothetical protein n=1 Tax=Streptomyces sp. NPDC026092 TaxID=3154797 RepID=UPI0033F36D75
MSSHVSGGRRGRRALVVTLVAVPVLAVLTAAGIWVYGVYAMSDPLNPGLVGIRIDGSRVSIKAATCPTEAVDKVQVFDGESEKPVWQARAPKTPEGKRGALTLWAADAYEHPGPVRQSTPLPKLLDVALTMADGEGGGGDMFDTAVVKAAKVPEGQYWTVNGPKTAEAIDGLLMCGSPNRSSS